MASLLTEIWGLILDQLYLDSPRALGSVLLASRGLYELAFPYTYRSIHVHKLHLTSLDDQESDYIKKIRARAQIYTKEIIVDTAIEVNLFDSLIPSIRKLEQLRWQYWKDAIPIEVLETLTQHPSRPRLLIEELPTQSACSVFPSHVHFESFPRLLHCTSLHTIDFQLEDKDGDLVTLLKDVVISCPNLKVLRLDLSSKYTLKGARSSWHFGLDLDDMFPPLQELVLSGYNGEWPMDMLKYDFWDWSELKVLKLQNSKAYSILQSVQSLQLGIDTFVFDDRQQYVDKDYHFYDSDNNHADWPARYDAEVLLHHFVLNCTGINSLHVSCVRGRLPLSTITKHGSSLQSLTTREYNGWNRREASVSPALSADDLNFLNANCPYLESLAVDMQRSAQWDNDFLDALSRFPRLHTLRLYIGLPSGPKFTRTGGNATFARRLFCHFRTSKVGVALRVLYLSVGEPQDGKWRPLLFPTEIFEREFKCYLNEANKLIVEDSKHVETGRKKVLLQKLRSRD